MTSTQIILRFMASSTKKGRPANRGNEVCPELVKLKHDIEDFPQKNGTMLFNILLGNIGANEGCRLSTWKTWRWMFYSNWLIIDNNYNVYNTFRAVSWLHIHYLDCSCNKSDKETVQDWTHKWGVGCVCVREWLSWESGLVRLKLPKVATFLTIFCSSFFF